MSINSVNGNASRTYNTIEEKPQEMTEKKAVCRLKTSRPDESNVAIKSLGVPKKYGNFDKGAGISVFTGPPNVIWASPDGKGWACGGPDENPYDATLPIKNEQPVEDITPCPINKQPDIFNAINNLLDQLLLLIQSLLGTSEPTPKPDPEQLVKEYTSQLISNGYKHTKDLGQGWQKYEMGSGYADIDETIYVHESGEIYKRNEMTIAGPTDDWSHKILGETDWEKLENPTSVLPDIITDDAYSTKDKLVITNAEEAFDAFDQEYKTTVIGGAQNPDGSANTNTTIIPKDQKISLHEFKDMFRRLGHPLYQEEQPFNPFQSDEPVNSEIENLFNRYNTDKSNDFHQFQGALSKEEFTNFWNDYMGDKIWENVQPDHNLDQVFCAP